VAGCWSLSHPVLVWDVHCGVEQTVEYLGFECGYSFNYQAFIRSKQLGRAKVTNRAEGTFGNAVIRQFYGKIISKWVAGKLP
jgi:hypothetical protein